MNTRGLSAPSTSPIAMPRVLGYSFRALIVARFVEQSTMKKRRSSDAGLQE
jgi:hypothetical protein